VAQETGIHDTIGIDLVAMCVNDLVVQGAEPLFFLDYYATGKLAVNAATDVVRGIADGCQQAGCALIGGETAEMPGLYKGEDYDLAGFSVGAVERGRALDGSAVREGDIILGMASSGLHSNGFSLVRKVIADLGLNYHDPAPFGGVDDTRCSQTTSLGQALLTPTRIYVKSSLAALRQYANRAPHESGVHALAHITGGGLTENLPRVLPAALSAQIDAEKWSQPSIFPWLAESGNIAAEEMFRTFNCGLGMVIIVAPDEAGNIKSILEENGETIYNIGEITNLDKSGAPVLIDNMTSQYG